MFSHVVGKHAILQRDVLVPAVWTQSVTFQGLITCVRLNDYVVIKGDFDQSFFAQRFNPLGFKQGCNKMHVLF